MRFCFKNIINFLYIAIENILFEKYNKNKMQSYGLSNSQKWSSD